MPGVYSPCGVILSLANSASSAAARWPAKKTTDAMKEATTSSARKPRSPVATSRRRNQASAQSGCNERLLGVALRQREDLDAGRGHAARMLELRRQRAVARHRGPAVGEDLHMRLAEIDHRLDGEEHAGLQRHAFAGPADMYDVRLVVEQAAQPMAAEIAHHAHALRLDKALDGVTDIAGGGAGLHCGNA